MKYCKKCGAPAYDLFIDEKQVCCECYNDEIEKTQSKGCEKAGDCFRKARAYSRNGNFQAAIYQAKKGIELIESFQMNAQLKERLK